MVACCSAVGLSLETIGLAVFGAFVVAAPVVALRDLIVEGGWAQSVRREDNGIGIIPEDRQRIFEMFVRGGTSANGSGIGLAFCEQIVQCYRGRIWVDSTPGEGSTFCFTYPKEGSLRDDGIPNPDRR